MSASVDLPDIAAAREFLESFDAPSARRGARYHKSGAVTSWAWNSKAWTCEAVVQGSLPYHVDLSYVDGYWAGACTCPMEADCKHVYAVMLALLEAAKAPVTGLRVLPPPAAVSLAPAKASAKVPTTIAEYVATRLGRKLKADENRYVQAVQSLFQRARHNPHLTAWDLQPFGYHPANYQYSWQVLELWPSLPKEGVEFWEQLACALRELGAPLPPFVLESVDFERAEKLRADWKRLREIAQWKQLLDTRSLAVNEPAAETADFRVVLEAEKARIDWRQDEAAEFRPLKQSRWRQLSNSYDSGWLMVRADAAPLWDALHVLGRQLYAAELAYTDPHVIRAFNRILRLPGLEPRVVNGAGEPLRRETEPLRWELIPASTDRDDYRLRLVRADGTPPANLVLTLAGAPPLYVALDAIYPGPPPGTGLLQATRENTIPAPALESLPGLDLLGKLKVALPARLEGMIERVPLKVKVSCKVAPTYVGSNTESVEIKVGALRPDGARAEQLTSSGWLPEQTHNVVPVVKTKAKEDGRLRVFDRSLLEGTARLLDPLEAKYEAYNGLWRVRVTKKLPELFTRWLATVPLHVEIELDRELATLREQPVSGTVELNCEEAGIDWFDLKVVLNVTDTELTPEELKLLLNARGGYVRLGKKGWRRLEFNLTAEEDEQLARLGLNSRDFSAEPQRLHALQLADKAAAKFLPERQVEELRLRVDELKARVTPEIPAGISAQLRPYQIEGFHFLAYLSANRFGGILADDMGLGKTLQTLAWLAWLRSEPAAAKLPSLVVCPKSVMDNWSSEAGRFLPGLRVKLWKGLDSSALREILAETDLLVINYPQLRSIGDALAKVSWLANILDEGQYIKNPDSQTAQAARLLKSEHRLVLTGTPIENRLLDLWSLMSFAMPGVLGNRSTFSKRFDQDEDKFARRRLTARVRPFLLRRTKGQVARDLPDRIEEDLFCEMEETQKTLYRAELKHARQMLLKVETRQELNDQRFNILTSLLRLRQICCHPALVDREHSKEESAKLNALIDLLEPLMEEGHKVLVFSQFVGMLDLIREAVKAREWRHFYLAGDTENRGELVADFQATKGAAVFLISLKAGGFGLNLTAASYVALFDPWWNPAVENQAIDRTHRIGQTSKVIAYRLLIKGSIEEKIRKLQQQKSALAQDILGEESFASGLTLDDLRFLFSDQEEKI